MKVAGQKSITIFHFFLSEIVFREKMISLSNNYRFDNDKIFLIMRMITFGISP